jgi:unsaturated chondroitin disaccharide hydrolase
MMQLLNRRFFMLSEQNQIWLDKAYNLLQEKMKRELERVGSKIPFAAINGQFHDLMMPDGISWWTNGFWTGLLWQMYHATKEEDYKAVAQETEERLAEALVTFDKLNHDVGFMFMPSSVANYRLTQNAKSKSRALHAANLLAGRFNPTGEFLRAWDTNSFGSGDVRGFMIIDSLMNLPLLYWASEETGDPRFAAIANKHAFTSLHSILRPDGSCNHIAAFDPESGEFLGGIGGQGYGEGSSWSRGQAWAVYGYALTYRYTKKEEFLNAAKQCAHYCISSLAMSNWLPLSDFRASAEPVKYDSAAAAIIACGLLELAEQVSEYETSLYTGAAIQMLKAVEEKFANWNLEEDGILTGNATMYHDDRLSGMSIIYGDYYFLEAILRLKEKAIMIW